MLSLRGIRDISEENICITNGSQEALYIIFSLFLNKYDRVIVERPTYLAALEILDLFNPVYIGLDIDDNKYKIDELANKIKDKVKLAYLIPTAQNPSGSTMSMNERKKIIELANEKDFLIVEDDAYGFLTFNNSIESIKSLDYDNKVIYIGTFSKILSAGLRIGYIVADSKIISKVEALKENINIHTSTLNQYIAALALEYNVIQDNLPKITQYYREKKEIMVNSLRKLNLNIRYSDPLGGLFVFLWLDNKIDTLKLYDRAVNEGVVYFPGKFFYYDGRGLNTMRLSFAQPPKDKIEEGIEKLGKVLSEYHG